VRDADDEHQRRSRRGLWRGNRPRLYRAAARDDGEKQHLRERSAATCAGDHGVPAACVIHVNVGDDGDRTAGDAPAVESPLQSMAMPYRSELEARIAKKTTKAIVDFAMLEEGDRVMVGLSGGKDSWALLQVLDVLRERAPISFSLVAVNVDSGYKEYKHELIASTCRARGWEYRIEHTGIGQTIDDLLDDGATPCSLCARLRRGVLYRLAKEEGATKIALCHHADDFIETLLLNLFFAGALKAVPAKLVSDDGANVVIRPLVYVGEDEARAYPKQCELPIIGCCCPACGDLGLQRQRTKRLLMELEREHPGVKQSMLKALGNVAPRHLLDTRLNPPAELKVRLKADPTTAGLKADPTTAGLKADPTTARLKVDPTTARLKLD